MIMPGSNYSFEIYNLDSGELCEEIEVSEIRSRGVIVAVVVSSIPHIILWRHFVLYPECPYKAP